MLDWRDATNVLSIEKGGSVMVSKNLTAPATF